MTHLKKMTGPGKATKSKRGPRPRTAARAKAGGPAMQAGARYQNRAAAWFAVQMLAEADLPWDLPEGTTIASVSCETTYSVDDIFAQSSQGGGLYGQAKTGLSGIRNSCRRWNNACDSTRPLSGLIEQIHPST